jgi:hypothetical protein
MLSVAMMSFGAVTMDHGRHLSYTQILNYNPGSKVTDHANVDLDQKAIESELGTLPQGFATAKAIYEKGAHSKPRAVCTLDAKQTVAIKKKDPVTFTTVGGAAGVGKYYEDKTGEVTSLRFTYPVSSDRVTPVADQCYVGGLDASVQSTLGCIAVTGGKSTFTIGGTAYTGTCVNNGGRTLQGFSLKAKSVMEDCPVDTTVAYVNGCPYTSYAPYKAYYGISDYANQIVLAGLTGTKAAGLVNGAVDLTGAAETVRKEFIKKGTAYMNTWMYTIREFEDAIDDCTSGDLTANALSTGPVHAWDEGVAFYTGSLMVFDDLLVGKLPALDDKGKGPYTLANKRCQNFKTCGPGGDSTIGEAKANIDLFDLFRDGEYELIAGKCANVVPIKNRIVQKMQVPLIQGTLRYTYKLAQLGGKYQGKEHAEGAVFAAAILPMVHQCDPVAATTIYNSLNMASTAVDYPAVKAAFEGCYTAMGVTCADVGGLYDKTDYYNTNGMSAAPCVDSVPLTTGAIVAIAVGAGLFGLCLLCVLFLINREKQGKPVFTNLQGGKPGA